MGAGDTHTYMTPGGEGQRSGPSWYLAVAWSCERPTEAPLRLVLDDTRELTVGRGPVRTWSRAGDGALRLDLADRWMSHVHCILRAGDGQWRVEDAASKNGTYVDGARAAAREAGDGTVIEAGGTFMVLRRLPVGADRPRPPGLPTLHGPLERELEVLEPIARSRIPVLIQGETGTGKEVAARAIHAASGRPRFQALNCGAIPAQLVEAELFGARRGAFSGADEDRPGVFRSADGGTLLLDEIAELPAPAQAALLRALQEGEIQPVGASRPSKVDVRVLAATHQPLAELAEAGRFRRDLYARLRGHELVLPPVRDRREDLGLLIGALLGRLAPDRAVTFSRAAGRALFRHGWPLNVRELEHVLRATLAGAAGPEIGVEDLPDAVAGGAPPAIPGADHEELVRSLFERHRGNLSEVARELNTSRSHVQRLVKRYGIDVAELRGKR